MNDDHDRLISVTRKWERLYDDVVAERSRARALISWIDGACVDEEPHMVIREAINHYREASRDE